MKLSTTQLIKYSPHDSVVKTSHQVRTDCHSLAMMNNGNTRVYLNQTFRLDPGQSYTLNPSPINVICTKVFNVTFEDVPGVTYDSGNIRENWLEVSRILIDDCNFV